MPARTTRGLPSSFVSPPSMRGAMTGRSGKSSSQSSKRPCSSAVYPSTRTSPGCSNVRNSPRLIRWVQAAPLGPLMYPTVSNTLIALAPYLVSRKLVIAWPNQRSQSAAKRWLSSCSSSIKAFTITTRLPYWASASFVATAEAAPHENWHTTRSRMGSIEALQRGLELLLSRDKSAHANPHHIQLAAEFLQLLFHPYALLLRVVDVLVQQLEQQAMAVQSHADLLRNRPCGHSCSAPDRRGISTVDQTHNGGMTPARPAPARGAARGRQGSAEGATPVVPGSCESRKDLIAATSGAPRWMFGFPRRRAEFTLGSTRVQGVEGLYLEPRAFRVLPTCAHAAAARFFACRTADVALLPFIALRPVPPACVVCRCRLARDRMTTAAVVLPYVGRVVAHQRAPAASEARLIRHHRHSTARLWRGPARGPPFPAGIATVPVARSMTR